MLPSHFYPIDMIVVAQPMLYLNGAILPCVCRFVYLAGHTADAFEISNEATSDSTAVIGYRHKILSLLSERYQLTRGFSSANMRIYVLYTASFNRLTATNSRGYFIVTAAVAKCTTVLSST